MFCGKPTIGGLIWILQNIESCNLSTEETEKIDKLVVHLRKLEKQAAYKPAIPSYRPENWFNEKMLSYVI